MSPYYHLTNQAVTKNAPLIISFIIGLALAIGSLLPFQSSGRQHAEAPTQPATTAQPVTYETYLLLGVDALENARPRIEAVWLAVLPSDHSAVEVIGLPSARFQDQYNPETGLPVMSLQPYLRGEFAGALVFDRGDIVELTNQLGGVWLVGSQVNGEGLLGFVDSADPNQPLEVLTRQAAAVQSVIAKMAVSGTRANYVSLFDGASLVLADRLTLFDAFSRYYPLRTDQVRVRFQDG
jgi:hypothetical protein